ncbi:MAG: S26 family signal peptidase, partial [Clostridia bacterium]|nr:S26 family signal peptidase [Clostridia bacterium]
MTDITEPNNEENPEPEETTSNEPKEKEKRTIAGRIGSILSTVLLIFLVLLAAFNIYLRVACVRIYVDGTSMQQTLQDGDVLYADKNKAINRGDIVVIDVTSRKKTDAHFSGDYIIKRCIA